VPTIVSFALLCFTSFFTLINPLGVMPVFMTMTAALSPKARSRTARKAVVVSLAVLVFFAFSGQLLFRFFNISVDSLRVVGGLIFFYMGFNMLQARISMTQIEPSSESTYADDISITPLAIPMICGPGAITNAIVLMEDAKGVPEITVFLVVLTIVLFLTLKILAMAGPISKLLRETGIKVMMRIMGLIVMVIAVEFFFSGIRPFIIGIGKTLQSP
jgi:multiple antibiotic resistance protein